MGDVRFEHVYTRVRDSANRVAELRQLTDEDVVSALAGASRDADPLIANFLATEALNRVARGRRLVENIPDCVIALDATGRITDLNRAAERALGRMREDVAGRALAEFADAIDDESSRHVPLRELLDASRGRDDHRLARARFVTTDGASVGGRLHVVAVTVEGNVTGFVLTLQRVTAATDDAFEDFARSFAAASGDAVVLLRPDGLVSLWSAKAERLLGHPASQMTGRTLAPGLFGGDGAPLDVARAGHVGVIGGPYVVTARRADGASLPVALTRAPLRDAEGELRAILLTFRPQDGADAPPLVPRALRSRPGARFGAWAQSAAPKVSAVAAPSVAFLGALGFLAAALRTSASMTPAGTPAMRATAGIGLVMLGVAMWLVRSERPTRGRRRATLGLAAAVMTLAVVTLVEYATGADLLIDHLFPIPAPGDPAPGRMSVITAVLLTVHAGAIVSMTTSTPRLTQALLVFAGAIELFAVTGYVLNAPEFLGATSYTTGIALATLVALVVSSVGLAAARPREGIVGVLSRGLSEGVLLAFMLPVAAVVPLVVTWIGFRGPLLADRSVSFRAGFVAVGLALAVTAILLVTARMLRASDRATDEARLALEEERDRLETNVRARTRELAENNARLKEALRERETLLREVHHRVKNNLQVASGFLSLQAQQAKDSESRAMFAESISRVKAMAMIHERLYQSADVTAVDVPAYVRDLTTEILRVGSTGEQAITLSTHVDVETIDIDAATTCGLIINELVSNALKHAFVGRTTGSIVVSLVPEGDLLVLSVKDDGVGTPPEVDLDRSRSMGLRLVARLAKQLSGQATLSRDDGTEVRVAFPRPTDARRRVEEALAWQ